MMLDDMIWNQVDLGRTHTLRNLLPRGFCVAQVDSSAFLFVSAEVLQIHLLTKHVQRWQQRADAPPGPDFHTGRWGVFVHNNTIVAVSNQAAFKFVAHAPLTEQRPPAEGEDAANPEFAWERLPLFGRCWNSTWVPGGVLYNNKVYCFGGFDSDRLWSLDLSVPQLHWVHEPVIGDPPAPRFEHSCAVVSYNGEPHLMIHGGRTTAGILFTDAHLLHIESATWKELQLGGHALPKTPYGAALAVGDFLYAFGQTLYSKPHALRIDLRRAVCNRLYPWYTPSDNSLGMPCVTLFCRGQAWAFGITAPAAGEDWALSCNTAVLPLPPWSAPDHQRFSLAFHETARALVLANAIRHEEGHELDLPADLLGHVLEFLPNF